jgi:hypothetical protein
VLLSCIIQAGPLCRVGIPPMPSRLMDHSDHCPISFQSHVTQSSRPRLPIPAPGVTGGHYHPPHTLQVQLAETEAFSLNSDKSSSMSLEDPTACPPGPKDSKVSGLEGSLHPLPLSLQYTMMHSFWGLVGLQQGTV